VELLTDRPEDRFTVGTRLYLEGTPQALTISESSAVADGPGWWLRFREISSREAADTLRDQYLEIEAPVEEHEPGRWFFHELVGLTARTTTGEDLGTVEEIYRAGGAEVFLVRGPRGELDIPGVKGIVVELAPERGEMIVDMDALDLDARPIDDEDYVRPRDRRPKKQVKPKGPAQPPKGTGPVRKPVDPNAAKGRAGQKGKPGAKDRTGAKDEPGAGNRPGVKDKFRPPKGSVPVQASPTEASATSSEAPDAPAPDA